MNLLELLLGAGASPPADPLPLLPAPRLVRPPIATSVTGVGLRVAVAYNPRDRGNSAGADHYTVTASLDLGRLHRAPGAALCRGGGTRKPEGTGRRGRRGFWQLEDRHDEAGLSARHLCKRCRQLAVRLGVDPDAPLPALAPQET